MSVMEIIINGRDLATVSAATQASIAAAKDVDGVIKITAGNYGGRLGKSWSAASREASGHRVGQQAGRLHDLGCRWQLALL